MNSELGACSEPHHLIFARSTLHVWRSSTFVYRRLREGYFGAGGGIRTDATAPAVTEMVQGNPPHDRHAMTARNWPWRRIPVAVAAGNV